MQLLWKDTSVGDTHMVWCFDPGGDETVAAVEVIDSDQLLLEDEEGEELTDPALRRKVFDAYRAAGGEYAIPGGCEMEREEQAA